MKSLLKIGWLYPDLMNVYGDRGNIIVLEKRANWRKIRTEIIELNVGFAVKDLAKCDLLMMGGAQDRQQTIVNKDLKRVKRTLSKMIEDGVPGLYVCGGFQFLGNYYKEADGTQVDGLGIFDLYTQNPGENIKRFIGNVAVRPLIDGLNQTIVGFENHGGRTYLGKNIKPLGKVIKGYGNSDGGYEGAAYKNSIGTYMHGPILPKNPELADYLLKIAADAEELSPLDDALENQARHMIANRLQVEI